MVIQIKQFRAKRGPLLGLSRDRTASMATFHVPSKILFLLATVNQAPSPALRMSTWLATFTMSHGSYSSTVLLIPFKRA
jgi:hypothetical protein